MKKIMMILVMAAGLLAQKSQAITAVEFQSLYKANKNAQITRFQISASEQTVATGFSNGAVSIGKINGSNPQSYFFGQSISALALSRDESKLAVSYANGTQVIDLRLNKTLVQFNVESEILQFSPDSKLFVYADSTSKLKVMDLSLQTTQAIPFDGELLNVSFAENGQSLIIGTTDSRAKVYRFTDGKEFIVDIGNNEMTSHAELSADSLCLCLGAKYFCSIRSDNRSSENYFRACSDD